MRIFLSVLFLLGMLAGKAEAQAPEHTFRVSDGMFLLDDKPFQIISGEMHFARIPHEYWRDRLKMAKAMGLNTVATYVFWNYQEPEKGKFNFTGDADVAEFVRIAQEEGLWVIIRPSPYACAEWEFGGYPWWLLKEDGVKVRSRDPRFIEMSRNYFHALGKQLAPLQVTHGGPVIMVQLENEYGSYDKDKEYLALNRDIIRESGFDVDLYTCDGPSQMQAGYLPGILPAVNGLDKVDEVKELINLYHDNQGPYFIAEWYPGWFDSWGQVHHTVPYEECMKTYDSILAAGLSINIYMAHGGTTRGFMNGANMGTQSPYAPQTSSYDYDAPIDEAGNPTPKFMAFRAIIKKYHRNDAGIPDIPVRNNAIKIPSIKLTLAAALFDNLPQPVTAEQPLSFEDMDQGYGYVLYRALLKGPANGFLKIDKLRDFGLVYVNNERVAVLDRRLDQDSVFLNVPDGESTLDIFVENCGRINYGPFLNDNHKGITGKVLFNGAEIKGWKMYGYPLQETEGFIFKKNQDTRGPVLKKGTFDLKETGDTYLDMHSFGKGCVWVNGHNLGRYWNIGPQQTLYVPGPWLRRGLNEVVVFEELNSGVNELFGLDHAVLDHLTASEAGDKTLNYIIIKKNEGPSKIISQAAQVHPDKRQLAWQEMEFIAFTHFGVNTFTDREWGDGKDDPDLFNPVGFDASQWAKVIRDAGMKMIILTARHHDGFCLWPSKYTDYSVARSNWMNGRGDVVRAVADACRKYGLKFGVYLSPWDRHEPFYGDSPRYNEFFRDQLRELLTNYGEISEVWFDGACGEGPNGKKQVYDWPSYYKVIRELQPNAVIAVMGPDVRWVGTETGNGRETEWSVLPDLLHYPDSISPSNLENITDNNFIPGDLTDSDLGSRDKILNAKNLMWYPAETDVSIRPGWFYHELDDYRVKKPAQLVDIYFNSVGKNSVLLLNIPPDKQGRIHKQDVKSLEETHEILGKAFRNNLVNIDAQKLQESRTAEGYPVFEYSWSQPVSFNMIMLQEDIMKGQRIEKFHIDYWNETEWKTCAGGTTIGYKRLFRFWDTKGSRIRLVIESSRDKPVIKTFGVYHMVMKSEEGER